MKSLDDKSIDMVLTDPPYGTTACKWDTVIPFEPMWKELKRICKGLVLLFGAEPFSSALRMSNIKEFKYDWIWKKNKVTGMLNASHQPMRNHEIISVFYDKKVAFYPIKEERDGKWIMPKGFTAKNYSKNNTTNASHSETLRKQIEPLRFPTTIKHFDSDPKRIHPTQKPVPLLEYLIKTYTLEGETVLDFTMGSGSTGVACKNLNRKFIGIEKDQTYFEIAKARIEGVRPSVQLDMMNG